MTRRLNPLPPPLLSAGFAWPTQLPHPAALMQQACGWPFGLPPAPALAAAWPWAACGGGTWHGCPLGPLCPGCPQCYASAFAHPQEYLQEAALAAAMAAASARALPPPGMAFVPTAELGGGAGVAPTPAEASGSSDSSEEASCRPSAAQQAVEEAAAAAAVAARQLGAHQLAAGKRRPAPAHGCSSRPRVPALAL